jgi:hypothetical protein
LASFSCGGERFYHACRHKRHGRLKRPPRWADVAGMVLPISLQPRPRSRAKSNAERQREFRKRNPGYYGRLHRKRKQELVVFAAAHRVATVMGLSRTAATEVAFRVANRQENLLLAIAQAKRPLMLPAPAETVRVPGVNAIPTREELADIRARSVA